ncbi:bacterial Ig-like domain-containing protein, partial [uncultured Treponema sp.]|uniref:bacterial Ig-like domain-containing protein n=1 Tax=uncultured Treponema sp. TaxID=162155 RepID=UPI0025FA6EAE
TVEVEGEIQLTAKVLPENAENTTITWTLVSAGEDAENPVISLDKKTGLVTGLAAGVAVVRASAGGVSSEFEIKVISFTSIKVTNLPTKTEYGLGEVLSKEGMVISAVYSDESEKVIANDDEKLEIVFDSSVPGEEVLVTVKYGEFSDTFTLQ